MMPGIFGKILLLLSVAMPAAGHTVSVSALSFTDIPGWVEDDHSPALAAFRRGCGGIRSTDQIPGFEWNMVCALARSGPGPAKAFFEQNFTPVRIDNGTRALFTGYFEPELYGSRVATQKYTFPLYRPPPEVDVAELWHTRAEIEGGLLEGRGLELVWLENRVDTFFVHVQGSARIRLEDGSIMRVGFAGRNGHTYRSVGRELVRRGVLSGDQVSIEGIRTWAESNPAAAITALQYNTSFIFFQELEIPEALGPIGALQVPLTPMRSIAVDDTYTPLGAPVWVKMNGGTASLNQLMVAQDTGSAVNGAQRADIYYGSGDAAGDKAGRIRYSGEMITLIPNVSAARLRGN